jgi:hypothetical protein
MTKKKPDMVTDLPASTPYPTNVGAPAFKLDNIVEFKETRSQNALAHLNTRLQEIKSQYDDLVQLAQDTEMLYRARHGFTPIVGKVYHLYHNGRDEFLSIIPPNGWSTPGVVDHLGSFLFTTENTWERVEDAKSR